MSRYTIRGHHPDHVVVVGYDPPLETFYLQVDTYAVPDQADHLLCWRGTHRSAIRSVAALAEAAAPYATLSIGVWAQLENDGAGHPTPTPLQRAIRRLLVGRGTTTAPLAAEDLATSLQAALALTLAACDTSLLADAAQGLRGGRLAPTHPASAFLQARGLVNDTGQPCVPELETALAFVLAQRATEQGAHDAVATD